MLLALQIYFECNFGVLKHGQCQNWLVYPRKQSQIEKTEIYMFHSFGPWNIRISYLVVLCQQHKQRGLLLAVRYFECLASGLPADGGQQTTTEELDMWGAEMVVPPIRSDIFEKNEVPRWSGSHHLGPLQKIWPGLDCKDLFGRDWFWHPKSQEAVLKGQKDEHDLCYKSLLWIWCLVTSKMERAELIATLHVYFLQVHIVHYTLQCYRIHSLFSPRSKHFSIEIPGFQSISGPKRVQSSDARFAASNLRMW